MTTSFLQKNIPVLTDVIPTQTPVVESPQAVSVISDIPEVVVTPKTAPVIQEEIAKPTPVTPYLVPAPAAQAIPAAVTVTQPEVIESDDSKEALWSHWKDEITENVMQTLLADIDQKIAQTIQTQLQGVLTQLSESIALQMKTNLETALQETVTQAIEEELQKFKN